VRGEVAIHPGAGAAVKRWRPEAWAEVADTLAAEFGLTVVLTGSAAERELCEQVAAGISAGATNLAGTTSLPELAAVYGRCRLVLGPDSGPLHVAVAAGTPTVHLYGPADPVAFGPWGPPARHRVVTPGIGCAPCGVLAWDDELDMHPCVRAIPVAAVVAAARAALGAT
jgi:heptosyltransferase-2/heptosyltransferase-3